MAEVRADSTLSCPRHPGPQRGYVVCLHILLQDAKPAVVELATEDTIGEILCAKTGHTIEDMRPICEGCAAEKGWLIIP